MKNEGEDEQAPEEDASSSPPCSTSAPVQQPSSSSSSWSKVQSNVGSSSCSHPPPPFPLKSHTLLGSDELSKHLQDRQAVFQITTWNMGSLPLPDEQQLRKIFYHYQHYQQNQHSERVSPSAPGGAIEEEVHIDVHIVSIQECWPDSDALELQMQMCLCPDFALFHSVSFGTLHMSIFIRRDLLWYTTECSETSQTLRSGRLFKTKGFIGVAFGLFGSRFLFINAHLSAGDDVERESQRAEELKKVVMMGKRGPKNNPHSSSSSSFSTKSSSSSPKYDGIFLCGDLNFRISTLKRERILDELKNDNLEALLRHDQLRKILTDCQMTKSSLNGFQEAATISFRPTYKYDLGTDNFDSSTKRRSPAYTDRVIYNCRQLPNSEPIVTCQAYDSVKDLKTSDHRPVYAVFSVIVKPGFDTLPLTGAQFKRDVFVKAVQQRAKFLLDRRKKIASSACSLM